MTLTNLRALSRYFSLGDSTSTDFADTDVDRQLNSAYQQLTVLIFSASREWQYRGDNSATTNITAATRQYSLPSDFLRISRVEVKYPSSTANYIRATAIDYKKIDNNGLDDYTASIPEFDLKGTKIDLFLSNKTADITAVISGLIIYYEDEITELSSVGDEPDIPEPFSRLMAQMAAKDYCGVNNMTDRYRWLEKEIEKDKMSLVEFIGNRNEAKKLSLRMRKEDYGVEDVRATSLNWS